MADASLPVPDPRRNSVSIFSGPINTIHSSSDEVKLRSPSGNHGETNILWEVESAMNISQALHRSFTFSQLIHSRKVTKIEAVCCWNAPSIVQESRYRL